MAIDIALGIVLAVVLLGAAAFLGQIVDAFFDWVAGDSLPAKIIQGIVGVAAILAILYGMLWATHFLHHS